MNDSAARRLYHRAMMAIGRGALNTVDDGGNVQSAQIDYGPNGPNGSLGIRDKTPVLGLFGFFSNPPAGSDAIALHVGGDRSNAVIIAHGHKASRRKNTPAGDCGLQDVRGAHVWLSATGIVIDGGGLPVTINCDLKVTGKLILPGLPTADPHSAGQLWNSAGAVHVSAG